MRTNRFLLTLVLLFPLSGVALSSDLDSVARTIADQISEKPEHIKQVYHSSFLKAVSEEKMTSLLKDLHAKYGKVLSVTPQERTSPESGKFTFTLAKNVQMVVTLTITSSEPHQVTGLWFGPATPTLKDIAAVVEAIKKLPGKTGFQLARLSDHIEVLNELNPDQPFAIGSTFKLYVLAAMVSNHKKWDEVVPLDERLKSLPSGFLQTWPAGSPVTRHTLASAMISVSDNTAADELLTILGREAVEKELSICGNEHVEQSLPFLTTMEMFKIKSDAALCDLYAKSNESKRRALLAGRIAKVDRDDVHPYGEGVPVAIDSVEWFASPADLVRLTDWLRLHADEPALQIMGINRGLDVSKEAYPYAGYKGGSEPGVLSMTWLLKRKDGAYFALTGSWNNTKEAVDLTEFSGLMQSAINLLAKG